MLFGFCLGGVARAGAAPAPAESSLARLRLFQVDDVLQLPRPERDAAFATYVLDVRQALADSAYQLAADLATRATSLWPSYRRPKLHLAAALLHQQRWGPSIAAAREARQANDDGLAPPPSAAEGPAAADYWEGLGLYQTQRYDEALPRLRAASEAAPDWAEAARALGQAAFLKSRYADAARAYARAYELDPHIGDVRDLSYYSTALAQSGDLDGGIAAMQAAIRRYPYAPGLHASLGDMLVQEESFTEAYYEYTLELLVHGMRGTFARGALDGVDNVLSNVDRSKPENHELQLFSSGLNSLQQGDAHQAVHTFQHLLQVTRSATPLPRLLLAQAQLEAGDPRAARDELEHYLEIEPDFVPALVLVARTYKYLGDDARARATHQRAKRLFPGYWKLQPNERQ